ncbi:MAG: metallophosphoesterase family protein [Acetobacterales bacterium]
MPDSTDQPRVPEGRRIYAVGDVHGRADLLRRLLDMIAEDAAAHADRACVLVYIGDYVDRGPRSRETIDLVLADDPAGMETVALMGNHEELMLDALGGDRSAATTWLTNGGDATLSSYGIAAVGNVPKEARDRIPAAHMRFLRNLRLTHREGDYLFVHAGVRPGVPLDEQRSSDLLWIREPFLGSKADHGAIVVHGHTPLHAPEEKSNRIGIDTGAFATGMLSCLVLDGSGRSYLKTR